MQRKATKDWQRRWDVGMILRNNARHQNDLKPLPYWITESPDHYATLKHSLPESTTHRIYVYDMDYRWDLWDEPDINDTNSLSFENNEQNLPKPDEQTKTLPTPPSPSQTQHQ